MSTSATTRTKAIPGPMPHTDEWYQLHPGHPDWQGRWFGASLAAAVCGQSQWMQPRELYEAAVNGSGETEDNEAMRRGRTYEPAILADYEATTGHDVHAPIPAYFHANAPHIYATLDGLRDDGVPVEAKFSMSPNVAAQLGEEGSDWVPTEWLFQTQQQMDVVGAEVAEIAVLLFGRLKIYRVERNDDLITSIHQAAGELYQRIKDRNPPDWDWSHPRALEAVQRAYPDVRGITIELPESLRKDVAQYDALRDIIKQDSKDLDEIKARILAAMGDAKAARMPGIEFEFTRTEIKEARIEAYTRKSYVRFGTRKVKGT